MHKLYVAIFYHINMKGDESYQVGSPPRLDADKKFNEVKFNEVMAWV
jgi:hypothetical protein